MNRVSERDESGRIAERLTAIRERLARMRDESSESLERLTSAREAGERYRAERAAPPPPPGPVRDQPQQPPAA